MGLCPKPLSLARPQGGWQTLSTYPYGEWWVDSKASKGKMRDFVALDPSLSVGVAKLTEADGLETCQGLRSNRVAAARPLQVGATQRSVVRVQEVFPAPARGERRCGQRPRSGVNKTLGGSRSRGKCAVGTHLRVWGLQGTEPALCSLALAVW